ncbi:hypothetical protein [Pseudonocardia sp. HH130630-07]|uniref:hypothetical protein n=1 Tax=Pseudonocardia sp. HH130630-07 TaxID=1690815 RepID=UPI000814C5F7|nr:hypothetical protein [Pseudonocardia sp. HH130630-07]ANY05345.1 hypothetical protein AFB00_02360 [Pseudonocardia sp. HH130630-07]
MLGHTEDTRGIVLPMDGRPVPAEPGPPQRPAGPRPGPERVPPGPALLLGWQPDAVPAAGDRSWGPVLTPSSELARRLARPGSPGPDRGLTFRLVLPEAFGAEPLLQLADRPDTPAPGGPAPSAALPIVAGGPGTALGLLVLTTAVEIVASGTQNRVLQDVTAAVDDLAPAATMRVDARLRAAEESLRIAQSELLEQGAVSSGAGLDTAVANLAVLRHQTHAWISGWERVVAAAERTGTPGSTLREQLGAVGRLGWEGFPGAVSAAYQALVLDARRILVTGAEHLLRFPNRPLAALRPLIESDLAGRAADVARLDRLLTGLSVLPLTVRARSGGLMPNLVADAATTNARTQALFTRMATALRAPSGPGPVVLEVQSLESGELRVLRPA